MAETREQGRALMSALCRGGTTVVLTPAALASLALLLVNLGLLSYGISFDRRVRRGARG
jgi:hypothetical protein